MKKSLYILSCCLIITQFYACSSGNQEAETIVEDTVEVDTGQRIMLPKPDTTVNPKNYSKVVGWEDGPKPLAQTGFTVSKFADGLDNPRWAYVGLNGDISVVESATEADVKTKAEATLSGK